MRRSHHERLLAEAEQEAEQERDAARKECDALKALVKDIWRGADLPPALARRAWDLVVKHDASDVFEQYCAGARVGPKP